MTTATTRRPIPAVNLDDYHKVIAKIESTFLGIEDHGIFTFMLNLDFGSSGQSAGTYALDGPSDTWEYPTRSGYGSPERVGVPSSTAILVAVLNACGVDTWEALPGRTIYALKAAGDPYGLIVGIAPLPTEPGRPVIFRDLFERYA